MGDMINAAVMSMSKISPTYFMANFVLYFAQLNECDLKELLVKGKISYFGLARNLIRHLISPNQDDLSYSPRTFISGHQIL